VGGGVTAPIPIFKLNPPIRKKPAKPSTRESCGLYRGRLEGNVTDIRLSGRSALAWMKSCRYRTHLEVQTRNEERIPVTSSPVEVQFRLF